MWTTLKESGYLEGEILKQCILEHLDKCLWPICIAFNANILILEGNVINTGKIALMLLLHLVEGA